MNLEIAGSSSAAFAEGEFRTDKVARKEVPQKGAAQGTLRAPVVLSGVGLHSGEAISLVIKPAAAGHGIVFRRTDVGDGRNADICARFDTVADTTLCTVIANEDGVSVGTVEHLMSAFAVFGIDNALVEVSAAEVPMMDGSAQVFAEAFADVGREVLTERRRAIRILKPVIVEENGKRAAFYPQDAELDDAPGLSFDFEISFDNEVIGHERFSADLWNADFANQILHARTFGLLKDVEAMWQMGLAKGGNLDNCVVVGADAVMNPSGLRYEDEFVRHKILDAVGDLALAGAPVIGRYEGIKSGHAMNNKLVRALFDARDAWEWVDAPEACLPEIGEITLDQGVAAMPLSAD